MTQEDKDLLLKDLCARLPYGVKVQAFRRHSEEDPTIIGYPYTLDFIMMSIMFKDNIEEYKPYLFPLSSMTEEQKNEYYYIVNYISSDDTENWKEGEFVYVDQFSQLMHFYYINHLDYMGLIPMGLAIDATGLNIY